MPLAPGQMLKNRYRIETLLGQGGMGAVYRAHDTSLDIPVALKENLDTSPEAQKQFEREAKILANLSHPNLPRVTDYFVVPGQGQYLVMDYIEGEDLQTIVNRRGPLAEAQALTWILQVCDALAYLHNQPSPIIHRDIKPANIKIRPDGHAILVDFGIAKIYHPHLSTTIGAKAVTPGYSPPEQYGAGTTDPRSDVYSIGATLYHLLTGQKPPESLQRMVSNAALTQPRQLNPQINPATEQTILKAIDVITDRRFQRVDELRNALAQSLAQTSRPPAPPTSRAQSSYPSATGRKSALPMPLILLIIGGGAVAALGCIICAVILQAQASLTAQTTTTADAALVEARAATAAAHTRNQSATAMAQARIEATAQAQANRAEQLLRQAAAWSPVIVDAFSNNANGWSSGKSDNEWAAHDITIAEAYRWKITAHQEVFSWVTPKIDPVGDFYLSVQVEKLSGASNCSYGLMFRQNGNDKYLFVISGNQYHLAVYSGGAWITLIKWGIASPINPAGLNRLTVIANGSHFSFYINDVFVDEIDDSRIASGKAGLAVELYNAGDEAIIEFDNFELRAP